MGNEDRSQNRAEYLRKEAEKKLQNREVNMEGLSFDKISKLVHELEVHQIELEMQNEELRSNHHELEESRSRYCDLFDFAPVGYFVFDKSGIILDVNLTACSMLGVERSNLINRPFATRLNWDSSDKLYLHLKRIFTTAEPESCELQLKPGKDGTEIFVQMQSQPVKNSYDNVIQCRSSITDITSRKHMEEELIHQRELLQRLFDNIPVLLIMWDPRLESFNLNWYAEKVFGWTTDEANMGDFVSKVYPDEEYRKQICDYMRSLKSGWKEWVATTKSGEKVPIEWANIRLTDETMIAIGVDLRDRKLAENEREYLLSRLKWKNEEFEHFFHVVRHDMGNPLLSV